MIEIPKNRIMKFIFTLFFVDAGSSYIYREKAFQIFEMEMFVPRCEAERAPLICCCC